MSRRGPRRNGPRRSRRLAAGLSAALLAVLVAACGATPEPSGPLGPCGDDAKSIGGYPTLEQLVPPVLDGEPPITLDSGRSCTATALGTLTTHGIHELRFAGGTWTHGGADATVIAVLATPSDAPRLEEPWIEEFYTAGAVAGKHTENTTTTRPTMDGAGQVFRLDTLNDLSLQSVVIWDDGGGMHVVIVASTVSPSASRTVHDERVADAVKAANVPQPG